MARCDAVVLAAVAACMLPFFKPRTVCLFTDKLNSSRNARVRAQGRHVNVKCALIIQVSCGGGSVRSERTLQVCRRTAVALRCSSNEKRISEMTVTVVNSVRFHFLASPGCCLCIRGVCSIAEIL